MFAKRFLAIPAVLWLSESQDIVARDDQAANVVGSKTENRQEFLPDPDSGGPWGRQNRSIVFVEIVVIDGASMPRRQDAIYAMTDFGRIFNVSNIRVPDSVPRSRFRLI